MLCNAHSNRRRSRSLAAGRARGRRRGTGDRRFGGTDMVNPGRRKLKSELEALRGIAAMIVFFHHFLLLIAPRLHGRNFPDDPIALVRTPLFALVNGSAAVAVLFVLSGFVLTVGAMEDRDWRQFLIGVLKRWPRLAPCWSWWSILRRQYSLCSVSIAIACGSSLHNYACCRYVRARCICRGRPPTLVGQRGRRRGPRTQFNLLSRSASGLELARRGPPASQCPASPAA